MVAIELLSGAGSQRHPLSPRRFRERNSYTKPVLSQTEPGRHKFQHSELSRSSAHDAFLLLPGPRNRAAPESSQRREHSTGQGQQGLIWNVVFPYLIGYLPAPQSPASHTHRIEQSFPAATKQTHKRCDFSYSGNCNEFDTNNCGGVPINTREPDPD